MTASGHQLPLGADAERVRYAPISGPYLKLIDWPKGADFVAKVFACLIAE